MTDDKLGATGDFPRGKLDHTDEGGLRIAIGTEGNVVTIRFGKQISWLGMPKQEAIALANIILKHADTLP